MPSFKFKALIFIPLTPIYYSFYGMNVFKLGFQILDTLNSDLLKIQAIKIRLKPLKSKFFIICFYVIKINRKCNLINQLYKRQSFVSNAGWNEMFSKAQQRKVKKEPFNEMSHQLKRRLYRKSLLYKPVLIDFIWTLNRG